MEAGRRLILALLALVLPPLGVWLARGPGAATWAVLGLFLAAQALFWLIAAGPGVLLWAAASLVAAVLALLSPRRTPPGKTRT